MAAGCAGCQRRAALISFVLRGAANRMDAHKGTTALLILGVVVLVAAAGAAAGFAFGKRW